MLRMLAVLMGVLSSTVLMAEMVSLGILWSKGCLTPQNLYEVRLILAGDAKTEGEEQSEETKAIELSRQEIQTARVMRVLELESREKELELLKTMTNNTANQLISERKTFDDIQQAFRAELEELNSRHQTESVEQARAVLLASPAESSVERLMALPMEEAVDLIRGMPEKSIAKILQGFAGPETAGGEPNERKIRGQQIFEALSRGEPLRTAIQETLNEIPEGAAGPPRSDG